MTKRELPNYGLFYPVTGTSLRSLYPELNQPEEFKPLSDTEMLLAWYTYNKTSPFYLLKDSEKIQKAIEYTGYTGDRDDGCKFTIYQFETGQTPAWFKKAQLKMETYQPDIRKDVLEIQLRIIEHAKEVVGRGVGDIDDPTKLKAYMDTCASLAEKMPVILKTVEGMFGISEFKGKDDKEKFDIFS